MSTAAENHSAEPVEIPFRSKVGLWLGPLIFIAMLLFVELDPSNPLVTRMAAVILLMAIWWITEAIPLSAHFVSTPRDNAWAGIAGRQQD